MWTLLASHEHIEIIPVLLCSHCFLFLVPLDQFLSISFVSRCCHAFFSVELFVLPLVSYRASQ